MSLPAFLHAIWTDGRVRVANVEAIPDAERREAGMLLEDWELGYREELPGQPPPFDAVAAIWGAVVAYRASQLALFRVEALYFLLGARERVPLVIGHGGNRVRGGGGLQDERLHVNAAHDEGHRVHADGVASLNVP